MVASVGDIIRLLASSSGESQQSGFLGLIVEAEVIDRYAQLSCQCPSVPRGGSTGSLLPGSQRLVRDAHILNSDERKSDEGWDLPAVEQRHGARPPMVSAP